VRAKAPPDLKCSTKKAALHPRLTKLGWIRLCETDRSNASRGDVDTASKLMQNALRIISRDPNEEVLLANLAVECADDSHALDRGQPLATLCLRAIAALQGIDGRRSADARRRVWAAIGVIVDDLSAPVLPSVRGFRIGAISRSSSTERPTGLSQLPPAARRKLLSYRWIPLRAASIPARIRV
jgi:Protein of unknown function N-terminus (DUF3323)